MATLTVYGDTADGHIRSADFGYSKARAGTGVSLSPNTTSTTIQCGQVYYFNYSCYEAFASYDTSSLPDTCIITAASEYLYCATDYTDTDYTQEVRAHDWGTSLTAEDWIAGADLGSYDLIASRYVAPATGYNEFAYNSTGLNWISKTGFTRVVHSSDRHRLGTQPTYTEYVTWCSADYDGTTQDPYLSITYTTGPAIPVVMYHLRQQGIA